LAGLSGAVWKWLQTGVPCRKKLCIGK
jgi:hypothetical protein